MIGLGYKIDIWDLVIGLRTYLLYCPGMLVQISSWVWVLFRFRNWIIVIRFGRRFSFKVSVMLSFLQFELWVPINGLG